MLRPYNCPLSTVPLSPDRARSTREPEDDRTQLEQIDLGGLFYGNMIPIAIENNFWLFFTMLDTLQTSLYQLQKFADALVEQQLEHLGFTSLAVVFAAGLLTSLTPCMLSMLPLTIAYIGGYESNKSSRGAAAVQSIWFALGLATTLAGLGLAAGGLGKVYGQIGIGLPIFVSLVAILMGLNLLEALPLQFPSLGTTPWISKDWPRSPRSYLLGLTFGLVASPCSTPVLAALLAWISNTGNPLLGGSLLLAYTIGYVVPLVLAGAFTATLKQLLELRKISGWISPLSGVLLVGFGVFSLLFRLLPTV